jgi:uncharacterized caspase-like protein
MLESPRLRLLPALLLPVLGAALVLPLAAESEKPRGKKYALLVGVNSYEHARLPNLKYAENDVTELAKVLRAKTAGFARVVLLTTAAGKKSARARPTGKNIRAELKTILARRTRRDTVLVGFCGHGVRVKGKGKDSKEKDEGFFCPSDAQLNDPATLIGLGQLFKDLDLSGAGVKLLLVDACRTDPREGRAVDTDSLPRPARGVGVLVSCSSGQRAFETAKLGKKGHGVFFHFVLEGLRGKAKNEDNEVTWDYLVAYVTRQVARTVPKLIGGGARQEPEYIANLAGRTTLLRSSGRKP